MVPERGAVAEALPTSLAAPGPDLGVGDLAGDSEWVRRGMTKTKDGKDARVGKRFSPEARAEVAARREQKRGSWPKLKRKPSMHGRQGKREKGS